MKCTKKKFRTKRMIQTRVNQLKKSGHWSRKDKSSRIYYCDVCSAWHMTAAESYEPTERIEINSNFKDIWNKLIQDI